MEVDEKLSLKASSEAIVEVRWLTDKLLTFSTTRPPHYSFVAGQYARLGLPDERGFVWRAYSMTSPPSAETLEFYGVLVQDGLFTTRLKQIAPGHPILVERQSFGFMTPDRFSDGRDLWMLGTGTGIGPYISMLRDPWVWTHFENLILVHGVRHADEFAYASELDALAAQAPGFARARLQVLRATTRDAAESGQLNGRITKLVEDGRLEHAAGLQIEPETARVMLCGNPAMIEDMRRLLHQRDMRPCRRAKPGHFVTENYW
jgi:ferredoxin/flavodoxin---NADP+ reductase